MRTCSWQIKMAWASWQEHEAQDGIPWERFRESHLFLKCELHVMCLLTFFSLKYIHIIYFTIELTDSTWSSAQNSTIFLFLKNYITSFNCTSSTWYWPIAIRLEKTCLVSNLLVIELRFSGTLLFCLIWKKLIYLSIFFMKLSPQEEQICGTAN